jgi:hypothetical protein
MALRKTALGMAVMVLAGCQGGMPLAAGSLARTVAPQTRAASVDGFKARIRFSIEKEFVARDTVKADKYLDPTEARMPSADFSRADKNRDNKLDLTEVLEYLHRDLYGPFNQRMVPIFKQLDANASNHLEEAEFARITLSSVGPDGRPMSPTSLMFRVSDRNRDFRVDYDEFEDLMAWDEANMLPEYFRGTPVTNGPVVNQPVPQPVVQPVTPQPPRVTPPPPPMPWPPTQPISYGTQPRSLTTTPARTTPHTQAPGDPPQPDPDF